MKSTKNTIRSSHGQGKRKSARTGYVAGVLRNLSRLVMMLAVTTGVTIGFLFFVKFFWHTYISTPMGDKFVTLFTAEAKAISYITSRNIIHMSVELTSSAFFICAIIALIARFFHLIRYYFIPRGIIVRLACWGMPLTAAVAVGIEHQYRIGSWQVAFCLAFVPTMCMFSECLMRAYDLIPELGDIFRKRTE